MPGHWSVSTWGFWGEAGTDIGTVWRGAIVLVVLADLVEVIFVQLADETGKVAVLEVFWEDQLGKLLVLQRVLACVVVAGGGPLRTSRTTKLSPPSPQRTMLSYDGSSNIL
jgi:hypothetical protein